MIIESDDYGLKEKTAKHNRLTMDRSEIASPS